MTGLRPLPRVRPGPGAVARTVISTWSAVSPYGLDRSDFTAGVRDERHASGPLVPGFDIREVLGKKGTRSMDRITALAVAATGQLLTAPDGGRIDGAGDDTALVLGINISSAQSAMDFTRDSLVQDRPYFVNPAHFPNVVLNCAAAQCAIWHRLQGPNATISGGRAAGLLALGYALRLQRSGRATTVACGAAEEYSATRARLEHLAEPERPAGALFGEGCAMVLLEPPGRPGASGRTELAEVLALEFGVHRGPADVRPVLAACLDRAFAAAGESPDRLWAVISSGGPDPTGTAEDAALADSLGAGAPVRLHTTDLVGDTYAASAAFGLAAALALAVPEPAVREAAVREAGRTALVTAVDRDGVVGCALLRLPPGEDSGP
ncbi:MAG TPA: beta-ketoacyl synthase N-terminal-like domain-containing protein [Streptosporangiaceae bacterium]